MPRTYGGRRTLYTIHKGANRDIVGHGVGVLGDVETRQLKRQIARRGAKMTARHMRHEYAKRAKMGDPVTMVSRYNIDWRFVMKLRKVEEDVQRAMQEEQNVQAH